MTDTVDTGHTSGTGDDPATGAGPSLPECDLIMKGGITSGVIYPGAAVELAKRYRFKQVGGASAGAIAAAFVAAAEHGRDRPAPAGFAGLEQVSNELGSKLSTLFQPVPSTKGAFGILTTWLEPGWSTARKVATTVWRLVRGAPLVTLAVFVVAMLPGVAVAASLQQGPDWPHWWTPRRSWLVWVPGSLVLAVLAAAVRTALRTVRAMEGNGFGLCNGHIGTDPGNQPLTDWMSDTLDEIAGRTRADGPLLFGHLWGSLPPAGAAAAAATTAVDRTAPAHRLIDLQVMTTCLTLRRPYRFPFSTDVFFACRDCMATYFPPNVVTALFPESGPARQEDEDWCCPLHPTRPVRHLPPAEHLPVVVAARISLSFPGLISAIPFCFIDRSRPPGKQHGVVVWFSDGGIASNFPMHFFDTLLPRRPTFGINLTPVDPDYPQPVWRAERPRQGLLPRVHSIASFGGFLHSILDTMQNWNDTTQLSLPGFRDRVVDVRTTDDEGGMNLKMRPETIRGLAERGKQAAQLLETFDFELHRWIRYRVAMNMLDATLTTMHERYRPSATDPGYAVHMAAYGPQATSYEMSDVDRAADAAATEQLMQAVDAWVAAGHPATEPAVPKPRPGLRVVPPQ